MAGGSAAGEDLDMIRLIQPLNMDVIEFWIWAKIPASAVCAYNGNIMKRLTLLGSLCLALAGAVAVAAPLPEILVSTDWLAQHLNDSQVVVLHISANRNAYDAGHIP